MTTKIAIVYHSGFGHTAKIAEAIAQGATEAKVTVNLIKAENITATEWDMLDQANTIVFGAPTYMGGCSGPFKMFIDATSGRWAKQKWHDKIAAGFTNSAAYCGDKLSSLQQLFHFAMQHSMIWVGQAELPPTFLPDELPQTTALNRLGSSSGLMSQSNHQAGPEVAPPKGDLDTAKLFGKRIVRVTKKYLGNQN